LIDQIHEIFHPAKGGADVASPPPTARKLVALHGLGGIGKSQIALEYAHRHKRMHSATFWVDARDPTVLETSGIQLVQQLVRHYVTESPLTADWIRIANQLGIPGGIDCSGTIQQEMLNSGVVWQAIKRWLQKKGNVNWLLLVDNHDDLETVNIFDYLPTCGWGKIIVTSRRSETRLLGHSLSVTEMENDVGLALLTKTMGTDSDTLSMEGIDHIRKYPSLR
jgi:hypothetical protein